MNDLKAHGRGWLGEAESTPAEEPAAELLRAVEAAVGLPGGLITAKLQKALVARWLRARPGSVARWMARHYDFEGTREERKQIGSVLYRLETRWRLGGRL